jgi:N-acetylglutamate synthase-like GNAT family acetyltransferase
MQLPLSFTGAVKELSMTIKRSAKETGISAITGKTVVVRHANDSDMVFIEENLKKNGLVIADLRAFQFVVAAEESDIIGFGGLRQKGDVCDIACVVVVEKQRKKGIGASIVKHLIEYAPVDRVYVSTDLVDYFKQIGFAETNRTPRELGCILDVECGAQGKRSPVLMVYEK